MDNVLQGFKNYFVPQEENGNMPHILRPRTIAFVCMIALIGELVFIFSSAYIVPRSRLFGTIEVNALVDETNQSRAANDLPALQLNALLQAAAQEKANDMATKGYFAHTSPQGLTPWYWFENVGYSFSYAGENLAVNFSDSQDVTNAWMNSAEHRANILSENFTQIGIATAQGIYNGEPATYVVEEFGTPAPVAAPDSFVNTAAAASVPTSAPIPPVAVAAKTAAKTTVTPIAKTTPVPTVVPIQTSADTDQNGASVAVKGAETQAAPAGQTSQTAPATPATTIPTTPTVAPAPVAAQSSWIQQLFSDPKALANDFYFLIMILFMIALIFNIFVNIQVQYPRLIVGGMAVIVVAGLLIMLNLNIGLFHPAVL
jgi:hypothetical protein